MATVSNIPLKYICDQLCLIGIDKARLQINNVKYKFINHNKPIIYPLDFILQSEVVRTILMCDFEIAHIRTASWVIHLSHQHATVYMLQDGKVEHVYEPFI